MPRESIAEHLEIALEYAKDREAIYHIRQALQLMEIPNEDGDL